MKLKIIMADPAGNRTAIVRTPVPAAERAEIAARLLAVPALRAEQAGFETAPVVGGAGRLEMMGGEFCGNAARSYGYLLWKEKQERAVSCFRQRQEALPQDLMPTGADIRFGADPAAAPEHLREPGADPAAAPGHLKESGAALSAVPEFSGSVQIEISGSQGPLEVSCDLQAGTAFAQMPLPTALEYTPEGYPLVISEGITHMILKEADTQEPFIRRMVREYGGRWDAFGMMFLRGENLTPVVYVRGSDTLVYESSCGSGSLAAAWYYDQTASVQEPACPGTSSLYRFREPGGEILVRFRRGGDGTVSGSMGGAVFLEEERLIEIREEQRAARSHERI